MKREKTSPTILEKAILTVEGFDKVFVKFQQQVALRGQSPSKLNNYIR